MHFAVRLLHRAVRRGRPRRLRLPRHRQL